MFMFINPYAGRCSILKMATPSSSFHVLWMQLQASVDEYDDILFSTTQMTKLGHDIASIHDTSTALLEDQETSSLQFEMLNKRFQNITDLWRSRLTAATDDLSTLKTDSRSAHGRVTDHVNSVDGRLRVLSERLQELEDGIKRNTRVLDRTEEDDARKVQELLNWNSRLFSKLQERLRLAARLRDELQKRLEKTVPRVQQWEKRLPDVEESVRTMLKLRGQLSETKRRLTELTLQVQRTEDNISSHNIMSDQTDPETELKPSEMLADEKNDSISAHTDDKSPEATN